MRTFFGPNRCPTDKPHLQKLPSGLWRQSWPDGWVQYIVTWGERCPVALLRHPYARRVMR
jgi:hypothetical protein